MNNYWQPGLEWMGDMLMTHFCPSFLNPISNTLATDLTGRGVYFSILNNTSDCWVYVNNKLTYFNSATLTTQTNRISVIQPAGDTLPAQSVKDGVTFSFWMQAVSINNGYIYGNVGNSVPGLTIGNTITSGSPLWAFNGGNADFRGVNNQDVSTMKHHVFVAGNNVGAGWWVNGVRVAGANIGNSATTAFGLLNAGFNNFTGIGGYFDDMRYYHRALSSKEIIDTWLLGRSGGMSEQPYRRRSYRVGGFKAYWHRRQSQVIGGGLR